MRKARAGNRSHSPATATGQKNTYAFNFPLKPGETQFQISYHLPYSGEASFAPKPLADVQHFVVMLPKGMSFTPKNTQRFQSMPDKSGSTIMVATNVKPGRTWRTSIAARASSSRKDKKRPARVMTAAAARWAAGKPRRTTIVPAADWAPRSMLPIRCTTTAP